MSHLISRFPYISQPLSFFYSDEKAKIQRKVYAAACLPESDVIHGEACFASGWGLTEHGGQISNELRELGVNVFDSNYCLDPDHIHPGASAYFIPLAEICGGQPTEGFTATGKDICQGDSGKVHFFILICYLTKVLDLT